MSRSFPSHTDGFTANNPHLFAQYPMVRQGISADLIATLNDFSREQCDRLAPTVRNGQRRPSPKGEFEKSLVPITHDDGTLALDP
jgi:acetyl-CoA C-acetyltransferase